MIALKDKLSEEDIEFRKEIHKRNIERKLAKLSQHPDLIDEYLELKKYMESL